ncbi:MAG TPA: MerR family transcriptional regulator [Micromonosporaceae bacterium]|jgi:DNA-binding transcriptional MerR regulator|nr:MerR family transcriptional regulator [Micromonosporaceae bacterium]
MTAATAPEPMGRRSVSPRAAVAADASSPPALVTIGEVLARLREDFPDVTISKLRFLEAEGLVEPRRTPAGYRKYSAADIARLRYVLGAQRDRFLPLRVIREQLDAMDREPDASVGPWTAVEQTNGAGAPRSAPEQRDGVGGRAAGESIAEAGSRARFSRDEVLTRCGLTDEMLTELEATGLLGARTPGWYDGDALVVAQVAAAFAGYGLAPRHLRAYRAGADREVGVFAQLLAPLQRASTAAGRSRAVDVARELTTLSQQLHGALVRIGLRDELGG